MQLIIRPERFPELPDMMSATFRFHCAREPGALWRRAFLSQGRSVSLVLRVAGAAGQNGAYFTAVAARNENGVISLYQQ